MSSNNEKKVDENLVNVDIETVVEASKKPEPVVEAVKETKPVVEAVKETKPVVEASKKPEPVVEAVKETKPVVEASKKPEPVVEAVKEEVLTEVKIEEKKDDIVEEEKKEDVTEEEKLLEVEEIKYDETKLLNLGKILGDLIAEETKINELKVNLKLNNEFIELMKKMNEVYPELLKEIDISLIDIIADKVIDSHDIPNLIVLVKNIYKKFTEQDKFKKINKITLEDSINFIKNLLLILIELGHIKVNDKEKVILIIDLCIDLLTSSIDLTQSLFQKLKSCMC